MSFHEVRFPTNISYGSRGGPGYNTGIITTEGGQEFRIARLSQPRHVYDVSYGIKSKDDAYAVLRFYIARYGPAYGFRYKDWNDYASTADGRTPVSDGGLAGSASTSHTDQPLGTGDGTTTVFQLKKAYTSGPSTVLRVTTKPVAGTVKVGKNGANQSSGWSIDTTTGVVTFSSAPAAEDALTWGGEFDVPVRFDKSVDQDGLMIQSVDYDQRDASIPLIEVPDPTPVPEDVFQGGAEEICATAPYSLSQQAGRVKVVDTTNNGVVILPDTANVPPGGPIFYIINLGPNSLTVKTSTGSTFITVASGSGVEILLTVDGGGNRVWYAI